ncbi:hypothetical protein F383_35952 [Gossypium arboreum]|uniref:Uncharacterized protein n=1 Tax=Gossypium arboreum TaxID=29729 RepID=A0A0B0PZ81_GOSAR|nr:hypothetical protein F383_35952 [Gossypium arboreum]
MAYFCPHGQRTGECLSRVQHMVMLHGRVSPGVPYDVKSVLSTAKAHGCVASHVTQVRFDPGQYVCPDLTWSRHTGMSNAV